MPEGVHVDYPPGVLRQREQIIVEPSIPVEDFVDWRIGRVLMARGRDAVDVALTTSFGNTSLSDFSVWAEELPAAV